MSKDSISVNGSVIETALSVDFLDGLNDAELIRTVDELETEVDHLQLENQVFVNFLMKNDPSLISGMAQILELASKMQNQPQSTLTPPLADRRATDESLRTSSRKTESILRFATTTSIADKGPRSWEQTHGITLPEDLRLFYSSSNGYMFEWIYTFGGNSPEEQVVSRIEINSLEDVKRVYGYETTNDPGVSIDKERYVLKLALASKIFELSLLPERGKVVLVYLYPEYIPSIWLLTTTMTFYFLADDIATYLRMAIAHLGISNWQLAYTAEGIPQWAQNMFRMIAPHLLPLNLSLEKLKRERRKHKDKNFPQVPLNKFHPNLFELSPRPETFVEQQASPIESEILKAVKKKPLSPLSQPKQQQQAPVFRSPKKFRRKPLYYIKKR